MHHMQTPNPHGMARVFRAVLDDEATVNPQPLWCTTSIAGVSW